MPTYNGYEVSIKYAPVIDENLYNDVVMQPGVTYSTRWQIIAGEVKITRLGKNAAQVGAPGTDFISNDASNQLISLNRDKNFKDNDKIYNVQEATVEYSAASEHLSKNVETVNEAWNSAGIKILVDGSTEVTGAALDKTTIYDDVIDTRKALKDFGAKPNVIIASTKAYASMLKSPEFVRASDLGDKVVQTGAVGMLAGMLVFEYQDLDATGITGTDVEYVMYDFNTLGVSSRLVGARVRDAEDFFGVRTQVEVNAGFVVTNAERSIVRSVV